MARVASLARLRLTDDELDLYTSQLAAVLEHAADVQSLDTSGVPATTHPLALVNVLRADVEAPTDAAFRSEVLAMAPHAENGRFRVPRILGEEP